MAWGLEARVPFLDRGFLDVAMSIPANTKTHRTAPYNFQMEKHVLRKAFDTSSDPYLPHDVLWRCVNLTQAKGAVFGRRWVLVDRFSKGARRGEYFLGRSGQSIGKVDSRHANNQGSVLV
jgi:Asparagine synthase